MIAFPGMLIAPAQKAGMKVPSNPDNFKCEEFPHFQVFCNVQLGASMPSPDSHWENAKVIAEIPDNEIMIVHMSDLISRGLSISFR